jgi:hypothetical protein
MNERRNRPKWKPTMAIDAYALAYKGLSQAKMARVLGVSEVSLVYWQKRHKLFRYALKRGKVDRNAPSGVNDFKEYVVGHLSPETRKLWDRINLWSESTSGPEKSRAFLANTSQQVRQSLWIHAYMACSFNASKACRMIGVGRDIVDKWMQNTIGFKKMIDEVKWHRNNYFEEALVDLVAKRDTGAVIFANRTQNKDRGYGDELEVKHSGQINHAHIHALADLPLSLECRREIREAMAKRTKQMALKAGETVEKGPSKEAPIDIEAEEVETEE